MTFEEGEKICSSITDSDNKTIDGRLVTIANKKKNIFIIEYVIYMLNLNNDIWLGARGDLDNNNFVFRWHRNYGGKIENGDKLGEEEGDSPYTNWVSGSPSKNANSGSCLSMIPHNEYRKNLRNDSLASEKTNVSGPEDHHWQQGQWLDVKCDSRNLVVCEIDQKWTLNKIKQKVILLQAKKIKNLN